MCPASPLHGGFVTFHKSRQMVVVVAWACFTMIYEYELLFAKIKARNSMEDDFAIFEQCCIYDSRFDEQYHLTFVRLHHIRQPWALKRRF